MSDTGKKSFMVADIRFDVDDKYELDSAILLGEGSFGSVCKARVADSDEAVAVKKIKNVFENLVDAKRTLRELRLLSHFRHDNIIGIRDIMSIPDIDTFQSIYIVTDVMDTDLHNIIISKNSLTDDHCKYFIYQILRAILYMHSANVLHRDLKPSNILINSNSDIKVCDFGLARLADASDANFLTSYVATRWYRAPEIILEKGRYSKAVDMWSVGCIIAEILGRRPLFPGRDSIHQLSLITDVVGNFSEEQIRKTLNPKARTYMRNMRPKVKKNLYQMFPKGNPLAVDMLEKLLNPDPDYRMTVEEALEHPYLAQLHMPSDEPLCEEAVDFSFEEVPLTEVAMRDLIFNEMLRYHPELGRYVEGKKWVDATPTDVEMERYGEANLAAAALEAAEMLTDTAESNSVSEMSTN